MKADGIKAGPGLSVLDLIFIFLFPAAGKEKRFPVDPGKIPLFSSGRQLPDASVEKIHGPQTGIIAVFLFVDVHHCKNAVLSIWSRCEPCGIMIVHKISDIDLLHVSPSIKRPWESSRWPCFSFMLLCTRWDSWTAISIHRRTYRRSRVLLPSPALPSPLQRLHSRWRCRRPVWA